MHVDKQGPLECALATVGALCNVPLSVVRMFALGILNSDIQNPYPYESWGRDARLRHGYTPFYPTIERLCKLFGHPEVWVAYLANIQPLVTSGGKVLSNKARQLPNQGKGMIVIKKKQGRISHIAPWENGLVYDPENPVPRTLKEFRLNNPKWVVHSITVI